MNGYWMEHGCFECTGHTYTLVRSPYAEVFAGDKKDVWFWYVYDKYHAILDNGICTKKSDAQNAASTALRKYEEENQ